MKRIIVIALVGLLLVNAAVFAAGQAGGQAGGAQYPARNITMICPWAAGGGTDAVARIIATLMQNELNVPVNVVNRDGGGGVVGHQAILSARPDGYTIGIGTVEMAQLHWMGLTTFKPADFAPIGGLNVDSAAITVPADKWNSYAAMMEEIRPNAGKFTASGTAVGGIWHLAMANWLIGEKLAPDHVRWIPQAGAAPAQQEMMAGGITMVTCSLAEVSALVDAGRAKVLAYMGEERSPRYPDVPTLKELGVPVTVGTWRGVFAPKGVPADIMRKLEETVAKAAASKEFSDFMNSRGFGIHFLNAKEWGEFVVHSDEQFGPVMKAAGLAQ